MNWLYINLASRTDRKARVEEELRKIGGVPIRIQAVKMRDGLQGCVRSHIRALEYGLEQGWDRFGVAEDDLEFTLPFPTDLPDCDIFLPSTGRFDRSLIKYDDTYHKVLRSQTTSSYVIKRSYVNVLLQVFYESMVMLQKYPKQRHKFALDIMWTRLQPKDHWLTIFPPIATQRPSYSDIEHKDVDYN
jgi:hypothetical protein